MQCLCEIRHHSIVRVLSYPYYLCVSLPTLASQLFGACLGPYITDVVTQLLDALTAAPVADADTSTASFDASASTAELVFIINNFLLGAAAAPSSHSIDLVSVCTVVYERYMSAGLWSRPTVNTHRGRKHRPIPYFDLRKNALLACLVLRGVGDIAAVVGGAVFERRFMYRVLYALIAKLGESDEMVSQTARATLMRVAKACGLESKLTWVCAVVMLLLLVWLYTLECGCACVVL